MFYRSIDQFSQHIQIHICQFVYVQTGFACFILPQPGKDLVVGIKAIHNLERQALFTRGEAGFEPFEFFICGVGAGKITKTNNAVAPL